MTGARTPPDRRRLLELMLRERGLEAARDALPPITPADRSRPLPLSFSQQRLWFVDQLEPANPAYNVPGAVRLRGDLDPEALARALQDVVDRHQALRTSFPASDGTPHQLVHDHLTVPLERHDLSRHPDPLTAAHELLAALARRPFDLTTPPLVRAALVCIAPRDHVLFVCAHHIVCDGWSLSIVTSELAACYAARRSGHAPGLTPLHLHYPDHAAWQRTHLAPRLDDQLGWWREALAGAPARRCSPSPGRR